MKVRLNKSVLADMPPQVRSLVLEWKEKWRKTFISVNNVTKFCPGEDAKVVMLNLKSGTAQAARVAGEFAGLTRLSPTDDIPLPFGCVAVCSGFFCGHPWLTIYQSSAQPPDSIPKLPFNENDCGGVFDGNRVLSDAEGGL